MLKADLRPSGSLAIKATETLEAKFAAMIFPETSLTVERHIRADVLSPEVHENLKAQFEPIGFSRRNP